MARTPDKDRVAADQRRINAGTRIHDDWSHRWSCDLLEKAYYGEQWEGESEQWDQRRYVINLLYPSIEISKPSMLFQVPKYQVRARPGRTDDPESDAVARAKLQCVEGLFPAGLEHVIEEDVVAPRQALVNAVHPFRRNRFRHPLVS